MIKIAFAGNPNVGKTALINAIAGSKLKVGNWPGVTVEKKEAEFEFKGEKVNLVDLPGVYSLSPYTIEEKVTRDFIIEENPDVIINVVDSTNLERNLYLTMLLKELGKPMIMALNFLDEFEKLNYTLDRLNFEKHLEMDAIPTSAIKNKGIQELLEKAIEVAKRHKEQTHLKYELRFDKYVEEEINKIKEKVKAEPRFEKVREKYSQDFITIKLLEQDSYFLEKLQNEYSIDAEDFAQKGIEVLEDKFDEDAETIFAEARYGAVKGVLARTLKTSMKTRLEFTDKIDKFLLNKYLGLFAFFGMMSLVFMFTFNGSGPLIDWVDGFIADYIGKYVGIFMEGTPDWLNSLVMDGIIAGVGGVLVFVPLLLFLYFFLAILEESGYMSRVAFLMDKIMKNLGLNGKAFVPMVLGFGCSVPAIYATRTLEDEKSRKLTAVMAPFMSCGARLPVYALFTAAFFSRTAGLVVLSLYMTGIIVAILLALILKRFPNFKIDERALLIELPPYRIPTMKMIWHSMWERTSGYIKKAVTIIMGVMIILWGLMYFPNSGDTKSSYLGKIAKVIQPIMKPTGFGDRWETVAAIPPSIVAKEVVVGFMGQVLVDEAEKIETTEEEKTTFMDDTLNQIKGFGVAVKDSVYEMLSFNMAGLFTPPSEEELEEQAGGVVAATAKLWEGDPRASLKAFSFMIFILLVVPCVVTLASIQHEFGTRFMFFVIAVMTIVPYIVSTLVYQLGSLLFY